MSPVIEVRQLHKRYGGTVGQWRDRTQIGWQTLQPHYLTAIERS
jgi:hypothetical protein